MILITKIFLASTHNSTHSFYKCFRRGTSFVEVLLFTAFFAVCAGILIPILTFTSEQRIRHQAISSVEQEGMQLLQMLSRRAKRSERILFPPIGASSTAAVFQLADPSQDPTVVALQTGAIVVAEGSNLRALSSSHITVSALTFHNTSVAAEKQSIAISFSASGRIALPTTSAYARTFETHVTLFPDDNLSGNPCACSAPMCLDGALTWGVCEGEICSLVEEGVPCD